MKPAKKILLIDDHGIVRKGIKTLIQLTDPSLVIEEASNFDQALAKLQTENYIFSLVDLDLSEERTGIDLLKKMHEMNKGLPAIILSGNDDRATILECLDHGASGFIPKATEDEEVLRAAIETILAGRVYVPSTALGKGGQSPRPIRNTPATGVEELGLSRQLTRTLVHIFEGMSTKEIARAMGISDFTARDYCSELYAKFGVSKRTQLIIELARRGIKIPAQYENN